MNYLWKNSKRVIVYEKRFLPGVLWMGDFDIILTFKKNRIWCRQLRNVVNFSHATQKPHRWQPLGVSCINENYDRHKKRSCMEFHTASWPVRESNPGLRRERASSWPLDQQAGIEATRFELATSASRTQRSTKLSHASITYVSIIQICGNVNSFFWFFSIFCILSTLSTFSTLLPIFNPSHMPDGLNFWKEINRKFSF